MVLTTQHLDVAMVDDFGLCHNMKGQRRPCHVGGRRLAVYVGQRGALHCTSAPSSLYAAGWWAHVREGSRGAGQVWTQNCLQAVQRTWQSEMGSMEE